MRIAIISDVHGNLTAFDAVLVNLRWQSPTSSSTAKSLKAAAISTR